MFILIQTKDDQMQNDNIIVLTWWLHVTNSKKYLKNYIVRNRIMKQ
jgi:hypothetical protein